MVNDIYFWMARQHHMALLKEAQDARLIRIATQSAAGALDFQQLHSMAMDLVHSVIEPIRIRVSKFITKEPAQTLCRSQAICVPCASEA